MDWPTIIAAGLTALIATSPALAALILGGRLRQADTATRYQEMANKQAEKNQALVDCVDALRDGMRETDLKIEALEERVNYLQAEDVKKEGFISELLNYIDYLTDLMKSRGIFPDRPRPTRGIR